MCEVVRLLHLSPTVAAPARDHLIARLRTATAGPARRVLIQPTLPGVRNGGDILLRLRFDDHAYGVAEPGPAAAVAPDLAAYAAAVPVGSAGTAATRSAGGRSSRDFGVAQLDALLADAAVTHVDGAEYCTGVGGFTEPRTPGSIYRVLLLRVAPDTPPRTIERFEADLLRMPHYIDTIRTWQLSRVTRAIGTSPWTHAWAQEFTDLTGLNGPYLMHPVHWAHVDRWFDPECPEAIVHDRVCHSFCANEPTYLA
ncbi:Dabb family protein [Nocardia mangyaensis]|uniref:Dabb family protein n=1 Tax=Nocardia mangyaensis TaxID=2213200 RepID=UPI0026774FFD|nr:Dabb family protein [Nocardia mangyaensis]MDO3649506.1 Dabb family protein [Nocardia mangyaensis]